MSITDEQLKALRERISAGKQPEHKLTDNRTFIRGWNEGLAYAEKCFREALGET